MDFFVWKYFYILQSSISAADVLTYLIVLFVCLCPPSPNRTKVCFENVNFFNFFTRN